MDLNADRGGSRERIREREPGLPFGASAGRGCRTKAGLAYGGAVGSAPQLPTWAARWQIGHERGELVLDVSSTGAGVADFRTMFGGGAAT